MTNKSVVFVINTVAKNKVKYSTFDIERAQKAQTFQEIIGYPSLKNLLYIVGRIFYQTSQS